MSAPRAYHFQKNQNHEHQRPHPPRRACREPIKLTHEFIQNFIAQGKDGALPSGLELVERLEGEIFNVLAKPPTFFADKLRPPMARNLFFVPRHWRRVRHASHDAIEVSPVSARGAFLHTKAKQW